MSFRLALAAVALTGCLSLSYEIVWFRAASIVTAGYAGAFGALLGLFLLGLALGALWARGLCAGRSDADAASQRRALAGLVVLANAAGFAVVPVLARGAARPATACVAALPLLASAGAFGAILPLASHLAVPPDDRAGQRLSYLYGANILGSVAGTLGTGFVLLDACTLARAALVLALAGASLTAATVLGAWRGRAALAGALGAGAMALAVLAGAGRAYDRVHERLVLRGEFRDASRFAYEHENRHGVVGVLPDGRVYGGGAYDGYVSTDLVDDRNAIWRAFALAAYHPRPRRVLVVGVSAGAWSQALVNAPGLEELVAVEINPGYLDLIARYPQVASLLSNPRARIVVDDARRWLQRHPGERFDAIVQNTTYHWRAHVTNLLSAEYLELLRAHLGPGGVLMYNTTWSDAAQRTGALAFPHANRLLNFMVASDSPLEFDPARWRAALEAWHIDGRPVLDLARPRDRRRLDELLSLARRVDPPGAFTPFAIETRAHVLARTRGAREVTDDNVAAEYGRWGL